MWIGSIWKSLFKNMLLGAQYNTSSFPIHFFLKWLFCLLGAASRYLGADCVFVWFVVNHLFWVVILKVSNSIEVSEQCPSFVCASVPFLSGQTGLVPNKNGWIMQIFMALSFETVNPSTAFSADLNCSYQEVLKSAPSDACSSFCKEMHSTIRNLHGATNQAVAQEDLFCRK